jgi:hypothetical protein
MTSSKRRQLLTALALTPFGNIAFAQDKTPDANPAACNPANGHRVSKNKANTGGKTQANMRCFPPGTPLNQLDYEAVDGTGKAVFTDTLDWQFPCDSKTSATVTWEVRTHSSAAKNTKSSVALWFQGKQLAGSAHSLDQMRPGTTQSFTQRLTAEEAARGRVSLFAQGAISVNSFVIVL